MLSSDGIHPNQTGYNWMGDTWYSVISSYFPWRSARRPRPAGHGRRRSSLYWFKNEKSARFSRRW